MLTIWSALTVTFFVSRALPGDPILLLVAPDASEQTIQLVKQQWGLDQGIYTQYFVFVKRLFAFDLGVSFRTSLPVVEEILKAARSSLMLTGVSIFVGCAIGVPVGVLWAVTRRKALAAVLTGLVSVGLSLPVYWVAMLLISAVSSHALMMESFLWPGLTLSLFSMSGLARSTFEACDKSVRLPLVTSLRARGLSFSRIAWKHVLAQSWVDIIVSGIGYASYLLGGAIITETLFGFPGLGRLTAESIFSRDYPILLGVVLFYSFSIVALNVLSDLLIAAADPRVELQ